MKLNGSAPSAVRLLVTLFGYTWLSDGRLIPSASVVEMLAALHVSEPSSRSAINRLMKRGFLTSEKKGRRTFYGIDPIVAARGRSGVERLLHFGEAQEWDGRWRVISFSIPEERKERRHVLRTRLRWQGFRPLHDGIWIAPGSNTDELIEYLNGLEVENATVFVVANEDLFTIGRGIIDSWELEPIRDAYGEFVREIEGSATGQTDEDAFTRYISLLDRYREFGVLDPGLPEELMPSDWPREQAVGTFKYVEAQLKPRAQNFAELIVRKYL